MSGCSHRSIMAVTCLVMVLPLTGCAVVTDLVNPDFLAGLGFDPGTIIPEPGKVLVAFNNTTGFQARFAVISTATSFELGGQVATNDAVVEAGSTTVISLDCPVGEILPGTEGGPAVTVTSGDAQFDLTYAGSTLVESRDFNCGDVIEIRLTQTGTGTAAEEFTMQVLVLRG